MAVLGCVARLDPVSHRVPVALEADFSGLRASDLNLVTALLVAGALILPATQAEARWRGRRRRDDRARRTSTSPSAGARCWRSARCAASIWRSRAASSSPSSARTAPASRPLLNVLAGDRARDRGHDRHRRRRRHPLDRAAARAGLVARVFQDPLAGTCAALTIEENLALAEARGRAPGLGSGGGRPPAARAVAERLAELGLGLENRLRRPDGPAVRRPAAGGSLLMATMAPSQASCCWTSTPPRSTRHRRVRARPDAADRGGAAPDDADGHPLHAPGAGPWRPHC